MASCAAAHHPQQPRIKQHDRRREEDQRQTEVRHRRRLPALCPHNLRVLNHILDVLFDIKEHGHAGIQQQASH
jgi:hypothetical protein